MFKIPKLNYGEMEYLRLSDGVDFILGKLPKHFIEELNNVTPVGPIEDRLVGHLHAEKRVYPSPEFESYMIDTAFRIETELGLARKRLEGLIDLHNIPDPKMTDMWVNFMKKHDFNPPHDHLGAYSFVVWTKLPYNIEDEIKRFPKVDNPRASMFVFMSTKGHQLALPLDNCHEGYFIVFPSTLQHYVAPFYTSDDYRISVSGNISFASIHAGDTV